MAPILATATGVTPQKLDDPQLRGLLDSLRSLKVLQQNDDASTAEISLKELNELLAPWKSEWLFEEQVDLYEWIHPLNVMDAALTWILKHYAQNMLLLPQFIHQDDGPEKRFATNMQQVQQCPPDILLYCGSILQFSAILLRNSTSKQLYSSVPAVSDLLAAADDAIADYAVSLLSALSLPSSLHKQQAPEHQVHNTQLHQASSSPTIGNNSNAGTNMNRTDVHDRLMATARAWGTRAMGLGLYTTVTADDSIYGQGKLPTAMGEVNFCYYSSSSSADDDESTLQEIDLSLSDMLVESADSGVSSPENDEGDQATSKKRRRVSSSANDTTKTSTKTTQKKEAKPTADLFFLAVQKAGGIDNIPSERLFSLLADIRLARCYHSQAARCTAVSRRLQALIAILNAHPSHEMMSGYFQAQPELCVEIVDLLRPVVSAANVSAASSVPGISASSDSVSGERNLRQDAIANLVGDSTQSVPFEIRMLAVEALTALVSRRDGSMGALAGNTRLSSILSELGVGKGQYLGFLPTLIRYSLASLGSAVNAQDSSLKTDESNRVDAPKPADAFDIGLAFVEATMAPPLPRKVSVERALQFIDNALTLTSAVVGTPTGTSALVDCGLIPALLTTVSMDPQSVFEDLMFHQHSCCSVSESRRVKALLRFVTAQAVQILESTIVTHSNALTAFHDLQGVEVLTTRLAKEIALTSQSAPEPCDHMEVDGHSSQDVEMDDVGARAFTDTSRCDESTQIRASERVLLFSIVTCLTVVFHQESTSTSATTPTGGSQLRKKELTVALKEILNDVKSYGGHLASLIATLLSDVMNGDPHVVHYVHSSGIAKAFLDMVMGNKIVDSDGKEDYEPIVPPVPELIMAIPNVISALALTEDGAKAVASINPFPALLRLFYHPDYAMPRSRCLLNEMNAIVGTGIEEIMRHVERLKPQVLTAVAEAMNQVATDAEDLVAREDEFLRIREPSNDQNVALENERSCLIQYVLNFGQLLEQILHADETCDPFVNAGGFDALLRLFPLCMPSGMQFLAYASSLSSPSVCTLHHSTTDEALTLACKCIEFRYNSLKLIRKLTEAANKFLDELEESQKQLIGENGTGFSLDLLPREPFHKISGATARSDLTEVSVYLRCVANVQFITTLIANAIKAACQQSSDNGAGWSRVEREWKKEISSDSFAKLIDRLSTFHQTSLFEVCRVRTEKGFEHDERERLRTRTKGLRYRLRIVCPEGAVIRDGIEIDSCANVGSLEMGDIVDAFDRCLNSNGILRYRTKRGWISEMTRGHGREPIAEVISLWESSDDDLTGIADDFSKKRREAGISGIRTVAVNVLARGQTGYSELFGAFSKLMMQWMRTDEAKALTTFDDGSAGRHVALVMKLLATDMRKGLDKEHVSQTAQSVLTSSSCKTPVLGISSAGAAMYLGCILNHLQFCLFDDKRERRQINVPLLVNLVVSDSFVHTTISEGSIDPADNSAWVLGVFDAIRCVFKHGLSDFEMRSSCEEKPRTLSEEIEHQRVGRSVAASFPLVISLLRRLVSGQISTFVSTSVMSRLKWKDVSKLLCKEELKQKFLGDPNDDADFQPEAFMADFQFSVSKLVQDLWSDDRLIHAPPFLVHPITNLVGDLTVGLESIIKKKSAGMNQSTASSSTERLRLSDLMRRRRDGNGDAAEEEEFEPSEDSITRLNEMGFSRDQALDALESIQSNQVETAMDYLLSNPPPSPGTIERRRIAREERARRRTERQRALSGEVPAAGGDGESAEAGANDVSGASSVSAANDGAAMSNNGSGGQVDGGDAMDVEQQSNDVDEKENQKTDEKPFSSNAREKAELALWVDSIPRVSCQLLDKMPRHSPLQAQGTTTETCLSGSNMSCADGDGEAEALTVVLCSFLLDLCHQYPDKRSHMVLQVLSKLKDRLSKTTENGKEEYSVPEESESSVSALCHASVLIARALPKTRLLFLKEGIVRRLVSCLQSATITSAKKDSSGGNRISSYPMWVAPCLLLLDIMAQPTVAFSDEKMVESILESNPDRDFTDVQSQHKEQVSSICQMANRWLPGPDATGTESSGRTSTTGDEDLQPTASDNKMNVEEDNASNAEKSKEDKKGAPLDFSTVPAYFPLLPLESAQTCLELCQKLLSSPTGAAGKVILSPGVAQSTMLLLLRLLRTPKVSSNCLQLGTAEAILALPSGCSFTGNTGLVTLIFRRLLEDESTLQTAMETEIRITMKKLTSKKSTATKDDKPTASISSFIEAVTPLLCRDPACFLKAMALTVKVEPPTNKSEKTRLSLLSPAERVQHGDCLVGTSKPSDSNAGNSREEFSRQKRSSSVTKTKGRVPHRNSKRGSFSKKGKKDKGDASKGSSHATPDSPASLITCLLINAVMTSTVTDSPNNNEEEAFLWTDSLLEILSDLILAVPACASAVHNFRSQRLKDKSKRISLSSQISHALSRCPSPPKTFVNFLLHSVLPQDRWAIRNDPQVWDRRKDCGEEDAELIKCKKKKAYRVTKLSQSSARVLVALVVRPGEGRRRVIADLVFSLSGGLLGHGSTVTSDLESLETTGEPRSSELHALQSWGELCLGIAAPRNTGNRNNLEGTATLNVDIARIMMEHGMAHALLYAVHRVRVFHPMASSTFAALLLPLEILTRANVVDAVKDLVSKEKQPSKEEIVTSDTAADSKEAMEEEPFHDEVAQDHMLVQEEENAMDDGTSHQGDGEMDETATSEDEELHSSDESEGTASDDESDDDDDEMDEDDESELEDSDEVSIEEIEEEGGWDVNYNGDGPVERQEGNDTEERADRTEDILDEGWTRIESAGFGGVLLGGRRGGFSAGEGDNTMARSREFIDAAEAMIGTLLQNGDISGEALAEIEGTLGIRIMSGGRSVQATLRSGENESRFSDASIGVRAGSRDRGRQNEIMGTLPHIHQRNQPDSGFSTFGRGGQWAEISSMEYVYGGPSVTGGSRNYDVLTSIQDEPRPENYPPLTQLDLQLFPAGPAAAASARTQHALHPLLCGVDLPPANAIVSDLLPHGVRATRRGQMTTRRPGDWTSGSFSPGGYLVSTSNGSIIRSNRPHTGALGIGTAPTRNISGPVGWTDDGLPVDATVEEFRSAFEGALDHTARAAVRREQQGSDNSDEVTTGQTGSGEPNSADNEDSARPEAASSSNDDSIERSGSTASHEPRNEDQQEGQEQDTARNDGDRVASSLVAGLRLSPGNESESPSEDPVTDQTDGRGGTDADAGGEYSTSGEADHISGARAGEAVQPAAADNPPIAPDPAIDQTLERNEGEDQVSSVEPIDESEQNAENAAASNDRTRESPEGGTDGPPPEEEGAASAAVAETNGLVCPPDVDLDVFNSLPREMQQDCVDHYNATQDLAAQLDGSSLDPEALAALPEELRREVIEQDRQERRVREQEQVPADPARAEEMDNASFIASLAPDLREEILLTADETFLNSLPARIVAEAQILRDRASVQQRRTYEGSLGGAANRENMASGSAPQQGSQGVGNTESVARRRQRSGKIRAELERTSIVFSPDESLSSPIAKTDLKALIRFLFLVSPVRPQRLLQKVFQNLCANPGLRNVLSSVFIELLHGDGAGALAAVESLEQQYKDTDTWRRCMDKLFSKQNDDFPPSTLLGAAPEVTNFEAFNMSISASLVRRRQGLGTAASLAANLPKSAAGANGASVLPPVVSARLVDTLLYLCKSSPRFCIHTLVSPVSEGRSIDVGSTCFEKLLELLGKPMYANSSANLEQLLTVLESAISPLSHISKNNEETEISQRDIDNAASQGKEWVDVPRVIVSQSRLQLLCSILRMEICRDTAFTKVNTIIRRLCRVEVNRGYVLAELASVAHSLGTAALRDLRALRIRMDAAVKKHQEKLADTAQSMETGEAGESSNDTKLTAGVVGTISSSVTLSTSTSELKLLRVLQTLQALCNEGSDEHSSKKNEGGVFVTEELVYFLRQMQLDELWDELSSCLKVVQILEGVKTFEEAEQKASENMESNDEESGDGTAENTKKLRNSVAGLLTRFLPSVEAFFVANASATRPADTSNEGEATTQDMSLDNLVGGKRMIDFVTTNRVLLNALIRNNPGLLDKGFRALVQVPQCRGLMDFDVKRKWFSTQMRRLRQHAGRRHGSLRLHIRRKHIFEDAYHQLRPRNADELRGRLHITFRNEEGVDAGGLSREFFGVLAKEMFNPNYALFTSTEDGCTFQPNPYSSINPDHLSYFRFVGRVVGKAVADGFLLDAHFTRSLYKHMLGMKPTHHDMEAIDPDYYRNLKSILEYKLADIGLDLTFSTDDHSFGRNQIIDLIPNGRSVHVTEENKEEYVQKICQHRMTTAIQSQIKSYLAGFYELVSPDLIAVFTPRELELLISGLPDIDVVDLKKNTDYVGWRATDKEILWFWNIMFALSRNEKAAFLQFVTGSSKVPLAGFSELQGMRGIQKFSIHKAGGRKGALMSAHTCFNSLDLPSYDSEEEMKAKLLFAINEGGGAFMFA